MAAHKIIALWSHPRALSTAFSRMMIERGDFTIIHEPFSNFCAVKHFMIGGERAESFPQLFDALFRCAEQQAVFFKDTTEYHYPEVLSAPGFLGRIVNTFIIRDPRKAIPSHYSVNPKVTLEEIGYEHQFKLFNRVREETRSTPAVIDADDLVAHTPEVVKAFCDKVQIPFIPEALSWESGDRKEWERTKNWHRDVNESTRITYKEKPYAATVDNNETLMRYYRHHLPFYQQMREVRLTVRGAR